MAGHAPGNIGITPEADSRFVPHIYPFAMAGRAGPGFYPYDGPDNTEK